MAKYEILFTNRAWVELEEIADYHMAKVGGMSAEEVTNRILGDIEQLAEYLLIGSLHSDSVLAKYEYRKLVCGHYICVYRLDGEQVYIYRIVHGSTNYSKWII